MTNSNPLINLNTQFQAFYRPVDNDRLTALFQAVYPFLIVQQTLGDIVIPSPDVFFSYVLKKYISQATNVYLPSVPAFNQRIRVKDGNGDAATYNITVQGNGHTIDGQTTLVLNVAYAFAEVTFNGFEWNVTGSNSSGSTPPVGNFLTDDAGNILTDDSGNPLLPS